MRNAYDVVYNIVIFYNNKNKIMFNKNESFNPDTQESIESSQGDQTKSPKEESMEEMIDKLSNEQKGTVRQNLMSLSGGRIDAGDKLLEMNLPEELNRCIAEKFMPVLLSKGRYDQCLQINETFNVPEEFSDSAEMKEAATKGIKYLISHLRSPESQPKSTFSKTDIDTQPEDSADIIKKARLEAIDNIKNRWNVSEEIIRDLGLDVIGSLLYNIGSEYNDTTEEIADIKDSLNIPDHLIKSSIEKYSRIYGLSNRAKKRIKEVLKIDVKKESKEDENFREDRIEAIIHLFSDEDNNRKYKKILKIKEEIGLTQAEFYNIIKEEVIDYTWAANDNLKELQKIKSNLNLTEEFFTDPDVIANSRQIVALRYLCRGDINDALKFKEESYLSESDLEEAVQWAIKDASETREYQHNVEKIKKAFNIE